MSSTSVARQTKALRLFVVLATATDNVNENLLMEYLLVHNIFGAFLKVHRKRYWERERILLTKREKITNHGLLLGVDWSRDTHNSVKQCVVGSCAAHQLPQARNGQFVCRATQSSRRWTRLGRKCVCVYMTQRECVCVYSYLKTLCIVLATFAMCVSLILSFLSFFLSFFLTFFLFFLSPIHSLLGLWLRRSSSSRTVRSLYTHAKTTSLSCSPLVPLAPASSPSSAVWLVPSSPTLLHPPPMPSMSLLAGKTQLIIRHSLLIIVTHILLW